MCNRYGNRGKNGAEGDKGITEEETAIGYPPVSKPFGMMGVANAYFGMLAKNGGPVRIGISY